MASIPVHSRYSGTWTVTYGDGSAPQTLSFTGRNFSLSHNYGGLLGSHTVTVTITDNLGSVAHASTTVNVLL